jgi:signal transduction histidine kinase
MRVWRAARSMWAEPAVADRPTRARRDQVLAWIMLVAGAFEATARPDPGWRPVAMGLGCVLAVAVLVRRAHGLAAVALAFGAFVVVDVAAVVLEAEPVVLYSGAVVLVLVYSLFRWGAGRDVVLGIGIVALGFTVSVITDFSGLGDALGGAAVLLFAAALGAAIRYRAMARERLVEQAKLKEREQLARELHDTIAHHVSAIAIQAQAGLVLARSSSPSGATEALEVIDREAARVLAEMRAMVSALRDCPNRPSVSPRRRLADIEGLAATGTDSLRVDVELRGDLAELTPVLEAALYRVAQESVTNAQRHAQLATRVEVTVTGNATEVQLTVRDDGTRTTSPNPPGYGLVGMSERVTLLGGALEAGPGPDRGWLVRAVLPRPRCSV